MAKKGDRILKRFEITETLATAGSILVYVARDSEDGMVTILELPVAALDSWDVISEIENRASQYTELSSPALPRFIGYFSDDSSETPAVYCVYEYVKGKSLEDIVEEAGPLGEDEVAEMLKAVLEGLNVLHRLSPPQLHGALRPESIVKSDTGAYRLTHLPMPAFPPRRAKPDVYTPPEQKTGMTVAASDLYALGMTARFAMTGKHPEEPLPEARVPAPELEKRAGRLGRVIAAMTAPDVADRPSSAGEVLAGLSREERKFEDEGRREPVRDAGSIVEVVSTPSRDSISIYNPAASRPENMLISLFLDLWASKPWLLILIAAVLSAGPVAIALIIFLFHPKSKILLNKAFAKTKDVQLTLDRRRIAVSDQLDPVEYTEIAGYDMCENPHPTGVQLETTLRMRSGKEVRFYLNALKRDEARRIMRLIDRRLHGVRTLFSGGGGPSPPYSQPN